MFARAQGAARESACCMAMQFTAFKVVHSHSKRKAYNEDMRICYTWKAFDIEPCKRHQGEESMLRYIL
jgi:hypothetical protein